MAKYSISNLEKKYNSFASPFYQVKLNGKDLADNDDIYINNVMVELTSGYEASVCVLEFWCSTFTYSEKKVDFNSTINSSSILGNKLEINMGYVKSDLTSNVFKGYITTSEFFYDSESGFKIVVEAMDVKAFMMNNMRSELKKDIKKYSEAVSNVLNNYSQLIDKKTIDNTEAMTLSIEQHGQSDYDFVVNLAKRINYQFYVLKGEVFFQKLGKDKEILLEMSLGDYIFEFKREITLNKQISKVIVRSNNERDETKTIEAVADSISTIGKGSKSGKDMSRLINDKMKKIIIDTSVNSEREAKARAEAELMKASMTFATGRLECIGMPELVPGKFISLKNMGDGMNNDYYITKVKHKIDSRGYRTICYFGVNKI